MNNKSIVMRGSFMFARSRYNWASSQVDTCLKYDFGTEAGWLRSANKVMEDDDFFLDVKYAKDKQNWNWYAAIAWAAGEKLASLHNDLRKDAPRDLSFSLIIVAAAATVLTKGMGVPQAEEWIEKQCITFGLVHHDDSEGEDSTNGQEDFVDIAWPFDDLAGTQKSEGQKWSIEELTDVFLGADNWPQEELFRIADALGISDGLDHTPWEFVPLLTAAVFIEQSNILDEVQEEMRDGNTEYDDLNVLAVMMHQTVVQENAMNCLELLEPLYAVMNLEWDEQIKGNVGFFVTKLEAVGISRESLKTALIEAIGDRTAQMLSDD